MTNIDVDIYIKSKRLLYVGVILVVSCISLISCFRKSGDMEKENKETVTVESEWLKTTTNSIDSIANILEEATFSTAFTIYDLTADSCLYKHHSNRLMRPASVMKSVTAISALQLLGPEHKYSTKVFYSGNISNGTLNGDIYVKGGFDPLINEYHLNAIADSIKRLGIDEINGCIYGDVSMKDTVKCGDGWGWNDVPSRTIPFLSALTFNRGCVSVKKKGGNISITPRTTYIITSNGNSKDFTVKCEDMPNGEKVIAGGTEGWKEIGTSHPERLFLCTLCDKLADRKIAIIGEKKDGKNTARKYSIKKLPDNPVHLICEINHTIAEALKPMLKESDNLIAESMLYQIAAKDGNQATATSGIQSIKSVLSKANPNKSLLCKIADGSGVSPYNYISPDIVVSMLKSAYNDEVIFNSLYPSLPIAGVDGTLAPRMTKGPAYNNIHAKTGHVTGVNSLAGYATASNGHVLAFAIMCNGVIRQSHAIKVQDELCEIMAR